ncbi:MAG TPA: ABC-F family ATP-binding cassette domain-containing protein [Verrucomicrobiae bacterium]|nr:ABC-F family ATP-binding cassette domain-containing protein [Verrucomicrobiae bacterium]
MLLTVDIETKSIGTKELFRNLHFTVEPNEKIGLIGRNGVGKTTLFSMLSGSDRDYAGTIQTRRDTRLVSTAQEHHTVEHLTAMEYILRNLPEYMALKHILDTYPETMGNDLKKIETYSTALDRFTHLGYYRIEEKIERNLDSYQISNTMARSPLSRLSGGQKRFVELVRVEQADADLALIDEPTNHMDYAAKALFINWLKTVSHAVLVITHDRDVLQYVDKIIEIKDEQSYIFTGNYEAYLAQNTVSTASDIHDYEIGLKTLDNLQRKIAWARARKPSWHGTADQRNPFKVMEDRLQREYDELKAALAKPSFWIDRESAANLPKKISDNYGKFKAQSIHIRAEASKHHGGELVALEDVQLGYNDMPLFKPVSFRLQAGERSQLVGRNGVGKTTLIKAIVATSQKHQPETLIRGLIHCSRSLRVSVYEQEQSAVTLERTLKEAVEHIYAAQGLATDERIIGKVLGEYLFDPNRDGVLKVGQLSGGQKARLQIIAMLAGNPNLLILDEPTNHLDLPSIEELENALSNYQGAVLYVSHDSYFAKNIGGEQLTLVR